MFLVTQFTLFATVDDAGRVTAPPVPMPYALLSVESPTMAVPELMPVNHRLDFLNFVDIDRHGAIKPGYQLLVSFLPYRGFLGPVLRRFLPVLHLFVMSEPKAQSLITWTLNDPKQRRESARYLFATPPRCFGCSRKLYSWQTRCTECNTAIYPMAG